MNWLIILFGAIIGALLYSYYKTGPRRTYKVDLTGKVVIITGASAGIGKETARKIAQHKATIIFACRNKAKTIPIIQEISKQTKNEDLHFIQVDLSNYDSVRQFVSEFRKKFSKLDILINNAGLYRGKLEVNAQQHEMTMAANHLGHFLLTESLINMMPKKSRIINVSSEAHLLITKKDMPIEWDQIIQGKNSVGFKAYGYSKFANIIYTRELQQRLDKKEIKVVALHPGAVHTEIFSSKNMSRPIAFLLSIILIIAKFFILTEEQGAQTTIYTALQDYEELVPAGFYQKVKLSKTSKFAEEYNNLEELIIFSADAVELEEQDKK